MTRCASLAPDDTRVRCQHADGHQGPHRANMVVWNDPEPADVKHETEAWRDGQVRLAGERGPEGGA